MQVGRLKNDKKSMVLSDYGDRVSAVDILAGKKDLAPKLPKKGSTRRGTKIQNRTRSELNSKLMTGNPATPFKRYLSDNVPNLNKT